MSERSQDPDESARHHEVRTPYIKQVVLQNFMCHGNFKLNLSPSMNVIVGTNGSGKSSILTGIMITLGGRTKTTSRGDVLGSLVQTGKTRATVSLKIHVPSEYRQMYQKYGNEVTITRIINSKGSSGRGSSQYKLKDSQNREVKGSSAQEVKSICQHFGLYPDNELAMLSQENAKEFLVNASAHVKYDKLRKALLQNVIEHDRALVNSHSKEQEDLIGRIKILRNSATEKEAKADEILGRARAHASASAQLKAIKLILAWRIANEVISRVENAEQNLAEQDSKLKELESQLDIETRRQDLEAQKEPLTQQRAQIADHVNELEGESEKLIRDIDRAKSEVSNTTEEIQQLTKQAESCELQIVQSERTAAELTPEAISRRRANIENQIKEAELRRVEASATMRKEDAAISDLTETRSECKDLLTRQKRRVEDARSQARDLQNEQHDVEKGNASTPNTPANIRMLQQLVQREKWDRKPLGPLYQFVRMKDVGADFAPALERIWTNTLEGWWVETEADRKRLLMLSERCNVRNLRIFKRKDDPFDFSAALPGSSQEYVRVIDVIETDSEAIRRILVDLNHIESLVLVEGTNAAFKVTDNRISKNKVRMALSMSTGARGRRRYVSVTSAVGRTESATVEPMPQARMKVGAEARIRQIRAELQEKKEELLSVEQQAKKAEQALKNVDLQIEDHIRSRRKAEALRRRAEDEQDTLNSQLMELETQVKSSDISDELESTRKSLKLLKGQIQDGHEVLLDQEEDIKDKVNAHEIVERDLRAKKQELRDLDSKIRRISKELINMEDSLRQNRTRFERQRKVREQMAGEMRSLQVECDEKVGAAEHHGPNPYNITQQEEDSSVPSTEVRALLKESNAALESKLNNLRGQQEAIAAAEEEIQSAQRMKEDAKQEYEKILRSENDMLRLVEEIKQRQQNRDENEARAWGAIKERIRAAFKKSLSKRAFVGEVEIDDQTAKLTTHSTPGEVSERSTSTLSGGEKSFTQVALLMAVWNTMHVGFVAMDEYDVYMDKVNRSLSLRLLSQVVESKDIQCVLITPQDIDARALKGMQIKIHKLAAARP